MVVAEISIVPIGTIDVELGDSVLTSMPRSPRRRMAG
jgi:hypothetical protein